MNLGSGSGNGVDGIDLMDIEEVEVIGFDDCLVVGYGERWVWEEVYIFDLERKYWSSRLGWGGKRWFRFEYVGFEVFVW